jgi:hypothetical protein
MPTNSPHWFLNILYSIRLPLNIVRYIVKLTCSRRSSVAAPMIDDRWPMTSRSLKWNGDIISRPAANPLTS